MAEDLSLNKSENLVPLLKNVSASCVTNELQTRRGKKVIPSTEIMGSVTTEKEVREKAKRVILTHDANAIDIIEILGLEKAGGEG